MNVVRKQCANCGTLHELNHDGPCDSCQEMEWRFWCTRHNTILLEAQCPLCEPPALAAEIRDGKFPFECPACGAKSWLPDRFAGHQVRCTTCKAILQLSRDQTAKVIALADLPATGPPASTVGFGKISRFVLASLIIGLLPLFGNPVAITGVVAIYLGVCGYKKSESHGGEINQYLAVTGIICGVISVIVGFIAIVRFFSR